MKKLLLPLLLLAASPAFADAKVGEAAPDITATTASGKTVKLSEFKGKNVVLEWTNPECPFVKKFYEPGAMQALQKQHTAKGVVWLTINSSAAGNQGNVDAAAAKAYIAEMKASQTEYLLDADGTIGKLYGAKTTPHMFVIDKAGVLQYAGAIDDKKSADPKDIETSKNYVTAALSDIEADRKVETSSTQPYGCGVKY